MSKMRDPAEMTEQQIRAEIDRLKPKVIEFERYHRRRWELLMELGLRHQRAQGTVHEISLEGGNEQSR